MRKIESTLTPPCILEVETYRPEMPHSPASLKVHVYVSGSDADRLFAAYITESPWFVMQLVEEL